MEVTPEEAIAKAAQVEETVNTPGWKVLMEVIGTLMEKEILSLMNQRLDSSYYQKIGMLQSMRWISELDTLIKDATVREYLLHQGRALGFETLRKAPQLLFDGRMQGKEIMKRMQPQDTNELELKKKFHEDTYRNS